MLVIFDVEGVLYDAEYLPMLAEKINKEDEIWEITKQGIQGAINWEDGLRTRVGALRGMDYRICKEVADSLPIMTGARRACRVFRERGWKMMAISGGFTIMTERLRTELGLDFVASNELIFRDGKLDGVRINVDSDKSKSAKAKIAEWGERKEGIICIADGANDLTLFDISGIGIAFRAQDIVKDRATAILEEKDLSKAIPLIDEHLRT